MKNKTSYSLSGNIVDLIAERIFKGTVHVADGIVNSIEKDDSITETQFILPVLNLLA